jgi:hypothetical protein
MVQLLERDTSINTAQRPVTQPAGTRRSPSHRAGETESTRIPAFVATNMDEVAALVGKLRPHELRWLAEDIMNAAIQACNEDSTQELRELLVSWLETADVLISTRRRLRHILRARQEMRDRFGRSGLQGRTA